MHPLTKETNDLMRAKKKNKDKWVFAWKAMLECNRMKLYE